MRTGRPLHAQKPRWHQSWYAAFTRPTYAVPVDVFRILIGLMSALYVTQLIWEIPDISAPDGYIDHTLLLRVFWFLRLSLFQPGLTAGICYGAFGLGLAAAVMVVVGWHPKWAAAYLYVVVVSGYRWNFLVAYLDDGIMHIALAWLLLLPIGRTLTLHTWLRDGPSVWRRWKQTLIPGPAVYSFLGNLALIYAVAGLWKWTSPMWRDGTALYAALKMPVSMYPDFWQPEHIAVLRVFNYAALVLEPILVFMMVIPKHHPLKWLLAFGAMGLHCGIIATLRVPYANAFCLFGQVLVMRDEIMGFFGVGTAQAEPDTAPPRIDLAGKSALVLVIILTLAMIGDTMPWWVEPGNLSRQVGRDGVTLAPGQVVEAWRTGQNVETSWKNVAADGNPFYAPLWVLGIAQRYRLFDWIDDVNYTARYVILDGGARITGREALQRLFPETARGAALQAYVNDIRWVIIPSRWSYAMKQSLLERIARRYCQTYAPRSTVDVFATVEQITGNNLQLNQGQQRRLMQFACTAAGPRMRSPQRSAAAGT